MKEAKRHGFITFWLWFCTILNGLGTLLFIWALFLTDGILPLANSQLWLRILIVVSTAAVFVGYIMLLDWRKAGFFVILVSQIVSIASLIIIAPFSPSYSNYITIPSTILGLFVLYFILQLRHDNLPYWDAMSKVVRVDYKE